MLSKEKALYQTKLIIDNLSKEEYSLIPKKIIDYIENNFEYDENITVNLDMPLDNQEIDDYTYEILDKIINEVEKNTKEAKEIESKEHLDRVTTEKENFETNIENIRLKEVVELLKKENSKIPEIKELVEDYRELLKQKDEEIESLNKYIKSLNAMLNKIPKFIRKIFIKENEIKLLESGK